MSAVGHADLELLHRYWVSKKRERAMPSRADIDPVELPGRLWPHLMLIDVVREEGKTRLRHRHVGTAFTDAIGHELTNRYLDEVIPRRGGYRDYILGVYDEVIRGRMPLYTENTFFLPNRASPILAQRLSLPLSSDGVTVDMAFTGQFFDYERAYLDNGYVSHVTDVEEVTRVVVKD